MANPRESKPVLHTKKHIARLERERQQTRLILAGFIAVLVVALGMIIYGYVDLKYLQARRPVARIANVSIPVGEWQARVRMQRTRLVNQLQLYQQYSQYFGMDFSSQEQQILSQLNSTSSMGQTTLDQLIDEELIRQESAKRGLVASTQEVDKSIQASFQFYPSGTPTPSVTPTAVTLPTLSADSLALVTITPTPTVFLTAAASPTSTPNPEKSATPALALSAAPTETAGPSPTVTSTSTPLPTATPYTLQGFETAYDSSVKQLVAQGLTEAQVHQLYENNVLRQKLFDQITADVPRTQDQVWARHILVASEATAKTVRERLVGGENFAKVAAELSTDTGTKDKGGDLGWFAKGAMVQEFESAAYSLKVGEISQPVKSQFGYHIIQVLAHEGIPLDASGYDQAKQTAFNNWLTKARADYKVVTYDNWQNIVPTDPPAPAVAQ